MSKEKRPSYVKAYQAWSTIFFVDTLAVPLIPILVKVRIHPNLITAASFLAGLSAGICFATGNWFWAAVLFLSAHFLDCIDGNVARLRGIASEFGAKLDDWADDTRKPISFLGIGLYFYMNGQILFVVLTIISLIVHVAVHKLYGLIGVGHCDLEFPQFHRTVIRRFAPRVLALYTFFEEFLLLFVLFPLIASFHGMPEGAVWFFWGILTTIVLSFLKLSILYNHKKKGRYQQVYQDWNGTKGNLDKA